MQRLVNVGPSTFNYQLRAPAQSPATPKEIKALEGRQLKQKACISSLLSKVSKKALKIKNADTVTIRKTQIGEKTVYKVLIDSDKKNAQGVVITSGSEKELIDRILDENGDPTELTLTHDKTSEQMKKLIKRFGNQDDKNTLYLYSSGGGGHKSAKDAQVEKSTIHLREQILANAAPKEIEAFNNHFQKIENFTDWCKQMGIFNESDVLADYLGNVGIDSADTWDKAQASGDVKKQEFLAGLQWLSDLFFGPFVFFQTLFDLIKHKPKQVVSTQAMATPSILLALTIYNAFFKPEKDAPVVLHLYMTDMPTKLSSHFFDSLKNMWFSSTKEYLALHAPKPTDNDTWQMRAGLVDWQVEELGTNDLPVRAAFIKGVQDFNPQDPIMAKVSCKEELEILNKTLKAQGCDAVGDLNKEGAQNLSFKQGPQDQSYFLMLGSQPTKEAIKDYVDEFISRAKERPDQLFNLFAFTGKYVQGGDCFYKELSEYIQNKDEWPKNLRVVPLSFQNADQIVNLELNCNTITRSGGGTIMELLVLNKACESEKFAGLPKRLRLIHAQKVEERSLVESIPLWERGNYMYLQSELGKDLCRVVNPEELFKKGG